MNLRALKTWHWIIIGLLAGGIVGITRVMWAAQETIGGRGYITQAQFEEAVHALPISGHPYVTDVVIHPCPASDQIVLVSLKAFDGEADLYRAYLFAAPRDFAPIDDKSKRAVSTVGEYLETLAASNPALKPSFAWWDATWATVGFYMLLGGAVIGGAWPMLLRAMGGPAPKDPDYDLNRFKHEPAAQQAGMSADDEAPLRELDDAMAASLGNGSTANQSATSNAPTPIRRLDSQSVETLSPAEQHLKDYAGEYYPVEKPSSHGFSLVELIVVIGIVTLLIAFALPALRYARMSAQTVKCAAQLQQIGVALHAYANENHGSLPAWSGWHTWPPDIDGDSFGPAWTIEMIPYIGKPDSPVYNCPSFPKPGKWRNYFLESQWSGRSGRNSMKLTDITMVGRFVLSGDTSNLGHFPADPKTDDSDPDDFGGGMLVWPSGGGIFMHLGGNNVLFDDGHVSLYAQFNREEITFNPHRMENHDDVTPD